MQELYKILNYEIVDSDKEFEENPCKFYKFIFENEKANVFIKNLIFDTKNRTKFKSEKNKQNFLKTLRKIICLKIFQKLNEENNIDFYINLLKETFLDENYKESLISLFYNKNISFVYNELNDETNENLEDFVRKIFNYRYKKNNISETFGVLICNDNKSFPVILSLEYIENSNDDNKFIFNSEYKLGQSERINLEENIKKTLDYIYNQKMIKINGQFIFTINPIITMLDNNSIIDGNSLNLPFIFLVLSKFLYSLNCTLENGICLTGSLNIVNNNFYIDEVSKVDKKCLLIEEYNKYSLLGNIKYFYIPELNYKILNETLIKKTFELKPINNLMQIEFIDHYTNYLLENKSNFEENNYNFESLKDLKDYFDNFNKNISDNQRYKDIFYNENTLLYKEGVIIPIIKKDNIEEIANFLNSFFSYNRFKLNTLKTPLPILVNAINIDKLFCLENYFYNRMISYNIPNQILKSTYKNEYSLIFIIYNFSQKTNYFQIKNIIENTKHYFIILTNYIEDINKLKS